MLESSPSFIKGASAIVSFPPGSVVPMPTLPFCKTETSACQLLPEFWLVVRAVPPQAFLLLRKVEYRGCPQSAPPALRSRR